jgi:hypothetical protein
MDPLTALSIATAVAQFVDFGKVIVKGTLAIRRDGKSLEHENFGAAVNDLISLNRSLKSKVTKPGDLHTPLGQHEAASLYIISSLIVGY